LQEKILAWRATCLSASVSTPIKALCLCGQRWKWKRREKGQCTEIVSILETTSPFPKDRRKGPLFLHFLNFYSIIIFKIVLDFCNEGHFYDES
jgi:hypothetical protein